MNLARYCLENARPDPSDVALEVIAPGGETLEIWTYEALRDTVVGIAANLQSAGLQRGDRVLIRLGHSSDFPLVFFGAIAGGFVPVPTSDLLTAAEVEQIWTDSGAALVVHDAKTSLPLSPARLITCTELKAAPPASADFAGTGSEDPAFLIYTSGTSGTPKGVLHAQRAAAGRKPMYAGWYGIGRTDRLLHAGAFNWTYTLGVGLMDPWANGATSVVYSGPREPQVWPALLEASKATLFAAVPSLYRRILKYNDVTPASFPSLRHGLTAGEALPAALHAEWTGKTGRPLYEALGMSEISTYVSSGPETPVRAGSPGKPQPGRKVTILQETADEPVPETGGNPGRLAVHRTEPGLMLGYWNRPEETAAAFLGDWFLTGDRARRDEDGYLWYEGRADDLMNAFGYRVAPEEIERALAAHPEVAEVAVASIEAQTGIHLITAFVVPATPGFADSTALADHAASCLAEYKRPKDYRFVASLPRTASGKVQRKVLGRVN